MKKTITTVLILLISIMSYTIAEINIQNTSIAKTHDLYHNVSRVSTFKYVAQSSKIEYDTGSVNIAQIKVANNTIDGFELTVTSEQGGILAPASQLDGEQPIPFSISIDSVGTEGTGVDTEDAIATSALGDPSIPQNILSVSGQQSSPTDLDLSINVELDDSVEDQMTMAGSYSDTLTFTYTDK